jgi:PAS domain S-box-containing protein
MKTGEKKFDEFEELVLELDMARIIFAEEEEEEEEARIVVSIKDITERKRAEVALRKSEKNFRRSLDDAPLGVRIVTIEGETIYANRAMLNIYGYDSIEELRATSTKNRYTPQSYAEFRIRREKRRQGEYTPSEYEISIVRKNSEIRHLLVYRKDILWNGERQFQVIYVDITDCKRLGERLKALILEKETMLNEIHHRVKNNLQIISSLLNTQTSYLRDKKAKEALWNSIARLKIMDMIHTQLYQCQDLTVIDFGLFIRDLIGNISEAYRKAESHVEIKVDACEISLDINNSIPCGLILNELVSNALKHAFPGGKKGEINIRMRSEDNRVVLTVQDNGIGFPESIDPTNRKSMGLDLVNILVRQMNGKIDMQVDSGTTWTIIFSINNERSG